MRFTPAATRSPLWCLAVLVLAACGSTPPATPCGEGTFSPGKGASCAAWSTCPAGQHVATEGTAVADRTCAPCGAGTYSTVPNQATCTAQTACAAGTAQKTAGTASTPASCEPCSAGTFCAGGTQAMQPCAAGTWDHDGDPSTACMAMTTCVAGSAVSNAGSATHDRECAACPGGTFATAENSLACTVWTECPPGQHVSVVGTATVDRACGACASGAFSDVANAATCASWTACAAGQYIASAGTATHDQVCGTCALGTYSSGPNQTTCQVQGACPAGTSQTSPGTATTPTVCAPCSSGTSCPGGTAPPTPCGPGTWDHDSNPSTPCAPKTACVPGQWVADAGTASSDQSCAGCASGTFAATTNATTCATWTSCAAGSFAVNTPRATVDRLCASCPAGTFTAAANAPTCTAWRACAAGQYVADAGTSTTDRACATCTGIANCARVSCTTSTDQVCTSCPASYSLQGGGCVPSTCSAIKLTSPSAVSGLFIIDPDGVGGAAPMSVYCDMATAGGGWTRVYYEDTSANVFFNVNETDRNVGAPSSPQYAILGTLEGFRRGGAFEFLMRWPGNATYPAPHQWTQTNNPVTDAAGALPTGYTSISTPYAALNGWGGLQHSATPSTNLLDGTISPLANWYFAVGTTYCWGGAGACQPGPNGGTDIVELLVR